MSERDGGYFMIFGLSGIVISYLVIGFFDCHLISFRPVTHIRFIFSPYTIYFLALLFKKKKKICLVTSGQESA